MSETPASVKKDNLYQLGKSLDEWVNLRQEENKKLEGFSGTDEEKTIILTTVDDADAEIVKLENQISQLKKEIFGEDSSNPGGGEDSSSSTTKKNKAKQFAKSGLKNIGNGAKTAGKKLWTGAKKIGNTKINFFSSLKAAAKNKADDKRINFFFIFALIIHGVDGFMNFDNTAFRVVAYMFLFFYGWLVIFRSKGCSWRETGGAAGISGALALGAFFVPLLMIKFLDPIMSWTLVNVLRICFPVYYLYFLFNPLTPLLKSVQNVVFWFWIFIFIFYFFIAIRFGTLDNVPFLNALDADVFENQDDADAGGAWSSLWNFIKGTIVNFGTEFWRTITGKVNETRAFGGSRLEYATGGYYSGDEENAPPQGVFITNIEYSQPNYIENETIEIAAMIDIQTPSDSLEFSVDCRAEEGGEKKTSIDGDILELPDGRTIIGYKDELLPLTCSFKEGLLEGIYDIIFTVVYNYETSSSLKIYFMDKERKDAMRAEGIDPIEEYGKEKNPKSIFTNGPIKLGIKQPALPIGIVSDGELGPLMGFTIENDWGGEIAEINSLFVYTPEGLSLDVEGYCGEFSELGVENGMNVYRITTPSDIGGIEDYLTINCKTNIEDKSSLLGDDEISTKQIKVIADYIFETEKSIDIRVK